MTQATGIKRQLNASTNAVMRIASIKEPKDFANHLIKLNKADVRRDRLAKQLENKIKELQPLLNAYFIHTNSGDNLSSENN